MKTCSKCHEVLEDDCFAKSKRSRDGLVNVCRKCNHQKYVENAENVKQRARTRYQKIKDTESFKLKKKEYEILHKEKIAKYQSQYREKHLEHFQKKHKKYYSEHADKIRARTREWSKKHANEPLRKFRRSVSGAIFKSLSKRGLTKSGVSVFEKLPYTLNDLILYIESRFDEHMSWNNQGTYWHLDHIIPQNYFNYNSMDSEEFLACWALENLRPLEAGANMRRSKRPIEFVFGIDRLDEVRQLILYEEGQR